MSKRVLFEPKNEEIPEYYKSTTNFNNNSANISLEDPLYPSYDIYRTKKTPSAYVTETSNENQLNWNKKCSENCRTNYLNISETEYEACINDCISNLARSYEKKNKKTSELKSSIEDEQKNPEFMSEINEIINLLNSIGYPNSSYIKQKLVKLRYNNVN